MSSGPNQQGYGVEPAPPQRQASGSAPSPTASVDLSRDHVPCQNCGYNLRGLAPTGACPECGSPVWRSLQGNLLIFSSSRYLASLHRGLICILIAVFMQLGLGVVLLIGVLIAVSNGARGSMRTVEVWANIGAIPAAALSLFGWWLFSAPDPAVAAGDKGDRPRRVIRITVIAVAASTVLGLFAYTASIDSGASEVLEGTSGLISGIAGIAQFFASMLYIRWLAPRLPDPALTERAKKYMWLLPVIYIVGACVAIGPLIATIMYLLMLNKIRLQLRDLRGRQAVEFPQLAVH